MAGDSEIANRLTMLSELRAKPDCRATWQRPLGTYWLHIPLSSVLSHGIAAHLNPVSVNSCAVPRPIEQLRAIARSPRPTSNFNRRTSLILRTDNLLAGKLILPFGGGCLPLCCPALLRACGNHSGEAERSSGIGLERRSESSRNRVHLAPDSPTSTRSQEHPGSCGVR